MPNAPNVDGLPIWLQIAVTLAFGICTVAVALRGYFNGDKKEAVIHLPDQSHQFAMIQLSAEISSLEKAITENTFHTRQQVELSREVCQRLRELRERLDDA